MPGFQSSSLGLKNGHNDTNTRHETSRNWKSSPKACHSHGPISENSCQLDCAHAACADSMHSCHALAPARVCTMLSLIPVSDLSLKESGQIFWWSSTNPNMTSHRGRFSKSKEVLLKIMTLFKALQVHTGCQPSLCSSLSCQPAHDHPLSRDIDVPSNASNSARQIIGFLLLCHLYHKWQRVASSLYTWFLESTVLCEQIGLHCSVSCSILVT